ncbi:MAG: T9SS type A sorting domain-containing protein [Bacteroidetes bacterium]|nr:T9SS type A sorting domain-containing protein [Bacteroidota bacterium]
MKSRRIFWLIFIALIAINKFKSQNFQWAKQIGGGSGDASFYSTTDNLGNVYIVGGFNGTVDFDPGPGTTNLTSSGMTDAYLVKLNSAGNFQWVRKFGGTDIDEAYSVTVDNNTADIVIAGVFRGVADFDPGTTTYTLSGSTTSFNTFVVRLNSAGNFLWAINNRASICKQVAIEPSTGSVCLVGAFTGTVDFNPSASTVNLITSNVYDGYILKLSSSGIYTWVRQIGSTSGNDYCRDIEFDYSGNMVIGGSFFGTVDFNPGTAVFNLTSISSDGFILKLNSSGAFVTAFGIGGSANDDILNIDVDASNRVYVTGVMYSAIVDFDPGPGTYTLGATGVADAFVAKYDNTNSLVWAKKFGGGGLNGVTSGYGITVTPIGEVFTTGLYKGPNIDFDPGTATYTILNPGSSYSNVYFSKLDVNGNFLFAHGIGDLNFDDFSGSINYDASSSSVYACGAWRGNSDFDGSANTYTMQPIGSADGYVLKLSSCAAPPAPVNTTASGLMTLCSGNSTTLTTTASGTVTWHSTSTSTTVINSGLSYNTPTLNAGIYTYYAQSNTSCGVSATRTPITVTVNPSPTVNISSSTFTLCSGQSATLTASGAGSYTWSTGSINTSIVVSPTTNTTYSVNGILFGCTSAKTATVQVSICSSVEDLSLEPEIFVYPNPSINGIIYIKSEKYILNKVEVFDMLGRNLKVENRGDEADSFSLSLNTGIYLIRVTTVSGKSSLQRIIIN